MLAMSCYDDQGNYTYHEPEDPVVTGLVDQTFIGYVGDSLIVRPQVQHSLMGTDELTFEWEISNHVKLRGEYYYGPNLRMLFNLQPDTYSAKLTISNRSNGMKYFYHFKIEGRSEFSLGTLVLSNDGGVGRLSFFKAGELYANIFEDLHGENLPKNPQRLLITDNYFLKSYQIITGEQNKPGVILDASTLLRIRNLEDNFFDKPAGVQAEALITGPGGVSTGIFNGKLYCGQWQTCGCNPIYGFYGGAAAGDYTLAPYFNFYGSHYLAYDRVLKRMVQFDINMGYMGADYQVIPMTQGDVFDPKNMDVDLIGLMNINSETTYAFGKADDGTIYEYKFQDVPGVFFVKDFREFVGADLIREDTQWQASLLEIIYFTSDDKIYRYNPVNQDLRALDADFGGKKVTMIKLLNDDDLVAGTEGKLHYLDVSVGQYGVETKVIDNIPGYPVDVVVRKQ